MTENIHFQNLKLEMDGDILVAVGSCNPVKSNAVKSGFHSVYSSAKIIHTEEFDVPSGVNDQPFGDSETTQGAESRSREAFEAFGMKNGKSPNFSVGIEGGLKFSEDNTLECFAWVVIYDGKTVSKSRSASFYLPPAICEYVKQGMELGAADDIVFKRENSGRKSGSVGYLTRGVIDRSTYYHHPVVLALIPFQWPEYYKIGDL